jgi:UDP-glucose 4-epimerase
MNVLITGGAGYIGSHVALKFLEHNCRVTIIDNLELGNKSLVPKKAELIISDISDKKTISKILTKDKIDVVIHLAAYTKVGESVENPKKYYENNYDKAKEFFNICVSNRVNNFIFSSTGSVYGNISNKSFLETDKKNPINPYSDSKLKTENFLENICKKENVNAVSLRYFNVAGSDKELRSGLITNPDNLIKAICEYIVKKRNFFFINGNDYNTKDGTPVRDFIHVTDLANIHFLVAKKSLTLKKNFYDVFNCGYGKGFSVLEIISEFEKIIDRKIDYKITHRRKGDAEISVANVEKIYKELSWKPENDDLSVILESALKWEKKLMTHS